LYIIAKIYNFVRMEAGFVDIHTHRPAGRIAHLRTAGIHPWDAERAGGEALAALERALRDPAVQAVGEIGLDFVRADTPEQRDAQTVLFRAQLALARERRLPVVLHCVRAFEETMRLLRGAEPRAVIFHGFIGSPEQARRAAERGYCLSFGERTFASPRTVEALKNTPLALLFFETDDSPLPIGTIYRRASEATGVGIDELKRATTCNYERIFG